MNGSGAGREPRSPAAGITVGITVRGGGESLPGLLAALAPALTAADELLIVLLAGSRLPPETDELIDRAGMNREGGAQIVLLAGDGTRSPVRSDVHPLPAPSPAAAWNIMLAAASTAQVAFLDDSVRPVSGWLESLRLALRNTGLDAVAGSFDRQPEPFERTRRPGARLRWTGHLAGDLTAVRSGTTSLVAASNFALRRAPVLAAGGFDENFTAGWPLAEIELMVRLGKGGSRFHYLPSARVTTAAAPEIAGAGRGPATEPGDDLAERQAVVRSLAAVFARHESWAVPIMFVSQVLQACIEIAGRRLPAGAPARIAAAIREGLRTGNRPVSGRLAGAGRRGSE